jgi:hypothetical protein
VNDMLTATQIAGYAGAGLAGAAYVPQISHLIGARCAAGLSRPAFGAWLLASCLVTTRAIALHAGVFIVLGAIQIAATAIIVSYAIRYPDTHCPNHLPASPGHSQPHRRPHKPSRPPAGTARHPVNRPPSAPLLAGQPSPLRGTSAAPGAVDTPIPPGRNDRSENLSRTAPRARTVELPPQTDSLIHRGRKDQER